MENKCLICPQTKAGSYYCSEHQVIIRASHEAWKWDQERETRKKLSRAVDQHLKNKSPDYLCQPATCPELKTLIEKEVFHE